MICVNCGKEIADGSKFCGFCGTPVTIPAAAPVAEQPAPAAAPVAEQPAPAAAPVTEQPAPAAAPVAEQPAPAAAPVAEQPAPAATPMPGQPIPMPAPMPGQPVVPPPAQPKKKKKGKAGLIVFVILLVVVLAAGGAGVFLWMNRPANKIQSAFAEGDLDTAIELYKDVKSKKDMEAIMAQAMDYAVQIKEGYLNEDIDYDTAYDALDRLYDTILEDDYDLYEMLDLVECVQMSREAYELAESYKESGDYLAAIEEYQRVIPEDANYDQAQQAITESEELYCQEAIDEAQDYIGSGEYAQAKAVLEDALFYFEEDEDLWDKLNEVEDAIEEAAAQAIAEVADSWCIEIDFGALLAEEMGEDYADFESSFYVTLYMDFNLDGTYRMYVDETAFGESFDLWLEDFISYTMDMMYAMFEDQNISKKEADKLIKDTYGCSIDEYIREMLASEVDFAEIAQELETTGYFEIDGNKIYWDGDSYSYDFFTVYGDTLTFEAADGNTEEIFPGMQYPLVLTRVVEVEDDVETEETEEVY